ncbi:12205_t:CDS:2, partial [Acaulospora morrowiae]
MTENSTTLLENQSRSNNRLIENYRLTWEPRLNNCVDLTTYMLTANSIDVLKCAASLVKLGREIPFFETFVKERKLST